MLAFSIDYYGIFFWATQFVELFCTYITAYTNKEQKFEQKEKDIKKKEGHSLDNMLLFA